MRKKVVVAMSGGVDSSVSAALLKEEGFDVAGAFMKCWSEEDTRFGQCSAVEDEHSARQVAAKLGIPFYSFNFVYEYRTRVVDYFIREYANGRTPNPDVMCNKEIKFGIFFEKVVGELGADYMATGHYARIRREIPNHKFQITNKSKIQNSKIKSIKLLKGMDKNKDQSYFLYRVGQEQLAHTIFPIGGFTKPQVRQFAREFGLPNADRPDSQGICFIGKIKVRDFLRAYIPEKAGPIVNHKGEKIGEHEGLHYYTIGQRKGIGVGGGAPYYVTAKDYRTNTLFAAFEYDEGLKARECEVQDVNWVSGEAPALPIHLNVKIRYRQQDQGVTLHEDCGSVRLVFDSPQRAVTSGQSAVFYDGALCLGGGIIV